MTPERLLHETTSLCGTCKNAVPAQVVESAEGEVWMQKSCLDHGPQQVRIAEDAGWYERTRLRLPDIAPPRRVATDLDHGCPFDCGPCAAHRQRARLPCVSITSACNLDCPICFIHNRNTDPYHMAEEDFARLLDQLLADEGGHLDVINITGGDPTMHPRMLALLERCRDAGIGRVSLCTNGIRLAADEDLVRRLAELDVRVALSFQSFDQATDRDMQGASLVDLKQRCLDLLEKHGVGTTLIPVMTAGLNDHEVGRIIRMGLERPNVRHIEIHTMSYTGQGGKDRPREGRTSMDAVLRRIEETTGGLLRPDHFVPSPCAHPLCYQIAYVLSDPDGGRPIPFLDFLTAEEMTAGLSGRLYLEPSPALERAVIDAIDRHWVEQREGSERTLHLLKELLGRMFPRRALSRAEALRVGETAAKAVYVHSHMDEETFDVERLIHCCDLSCTPDGRQIPICAHNVLYREREPLLAERAQPWPEHERAGGVRGLPVVAAS